MRGLFAPLVTPFDQAGEIDFHSWQQNLERYQAEPLDGFLINGSSGEAEMLNQAEQVSLLKTACEISKKPIIAGVSAHSLRLAQERVAALAELPLAAILVRTPSYFGKQLDQVLFFTELAQSSPHPIMIYQIPQYTGVRLDNVALAELAKLPNIIGIKDSLGDLSLLTEVEWPEDFSYLLGAAGLLLPALRLGAKGGILALANVLPKACRELMELHQAQKWEQANQLQAQLIPVNRAIGGSRGYGVAGLKTAVEIQGYAAGPPRKPLRPITSEGRKELERLLGRVTASTRSE